MYNIYIVLSLVTDLFITLENDLLSSAHDLWRPMLIYILIFSGCVAAHAVTISAISLFVSKEQKFTCINNIYRKVTLATIDLVLSIMKIRLHVSGKELVPENERFLLIGNHISVFDPMIAMQTFSEKELAFVSKKENIDMPFFGRLMHASGCLALDRENNRAAVKTIKEASMRISEDYSSMGIYPEGGINKTEEVLMPFHSGSFKIAKKSEAPIVITTLRNTNKLFRRFIYAYTDVYLDVIDVIQPEDYAELSTKEISDTVWDEMYKHLSQKYSSAPESAEDCVNSHI